ncbi:MAG: SpoIIE family protein phosphatase, partial [Synergistaceae bacterium]|nr:SpoIIE family protein phosphatase [Synergistaceae bacterium]
LNQSVDVNRVMDEIKLFGNLKQIWAPVMESYNGNLFVVYAAAESGFMISYGLNSLEALPEEGNTEYYYNFKSRPWYKEAKEKGGVIFTDIYSDSYNRGLMITCASPFYNAEGKFAGVVAMDMLFGNLYNSIVNVDLGKDSYTFLADKTGKIITPGGGSRHISEITSSLEDKIMSGEAGVSLSNSRVYYAYTPIKSTGWTLCASIPESVILEPVRSVNERVIYTILSFLGAFVVIVAVAVIAARKLSHKLTSPIIALEDDVRKISGGNLDYRAEIRTNDEIGDLAKSFNDMAASLKDYVKNLAAVTAEKERIGAELNIATQIQADMLPRIFPPFPERKEFDIYATMNPAKEVGGDFYDFFLVDDNHLALVMADVSGKGVPAALFMVIAKTLIKNRAQMGGTPTEILADVNNQLCEGNEADLFVTVWLGILEISTGHVTASNAGHEYPAIYRPGEGYTLFKTKQSPAVATMEGLRFKASEFTLNPGDELYLYTDGVAEATNSHDELYGTDRMIDALNQAEGMTVEEILRTLKKSVDDFTGDAPQFDDITMMSLKYYGEKC